MNLTFAVHHHHHHHHHLLAFVLEQILKYTASCQTRRPQETTRLIGEAPKFAVNVNFKSLWDDIQNLTNVVVILQECKLTFSHQLWARIIVTKNPVPTFFTSNKPSCVDRVGCYVYRTRKINIRNLFFLFYSIFYIIQ